jgi:hypothetical protein
MRVTALAVAAALILAFVGSASAGVQKKVVFVSDRANGSRELYVVNRDGSGLQRLTYNSLVERQPAWSPNSRQIAVSALDPLSGNWDIYSISAAGGDLHRLTSDPGRDDTPQWTADGRIVYQHGPLSGPGTSIWIMNADGSGQHQLPTGPGNAITPSVSPTNNTLAFASDRAQPGLWAIYAMQLNGNGLQQVTFPAAGMDAEPRFSPSGTNIVFIRDNGTQDNDLYLVRSNGQQLRQLTYTPDRIEFMPSWLSDDQILFTGFDPSFHAALHTVSLSTGSDQPFATVPQAPYVDSFDEPSLDTSFWYALVDPGASLALVGGQLVTSISGSAVPGGPYNQVQAEIGSPCHLRGDFDFQVDYQLLTWPRHSGYFASLQSIFADVAVARSSAPWDPPYDEQYTAWSNAPGGFMSNSLNTTDTSGTLRVTRTGSVVHAYERSGGSDWTQVFSDDGNSGEGIPQFGLSVQAWDFAHLDGSVAYDNFRLNSGALTCPSWWSDLFADSSTTGS